MTFYEISGDLYNLDTIQSLDYRENTETLTIYFISGTLTDIQIPQFKKNMWNKLKENIKQE